MSQINRLHECYTIITTPEFPTKLQLVCQHLTLCFLKKYLINKQDSFWIFSHLWNNWIVPFMYNKWWTFGLFPKWVLIIQICGNARRLVVNWFIKFIHGLAFSIMNLKLVNQVYKRKHQVIILKWNVDLQIIIIPNL